jgi:hypothetical protein
MESIRKQVHRNAVALISLVVAVTSLGYNSWRNETSEAQRNIRHASFRVLESLGELQEIADYRYYYLPFEASEEREGQLRVSGFGNVSMVRDLMSVMPDPAPAAGFELHAAWSESVNYLDDLTADGRHTGEATRHEQTLTRTINATRMTVIEVLRGLE